MSITKFRRHLKDIAYSPFETKIREATCNDPWGPTTNQVMEIVDLINQNQFAYNEMMPILWKRLRDKGRNWRHVYKSLTVLFYLLRSGNQKVMRQCKNNLYRLEGLLSFEYTDSDNNEHGSTIQAKAHALITLIKDEEALSSAVTSFHEIFERCNASGSFLGSPLSLLMTNKKGKRIHSAEETVSNVELSSQSTDLMATL